MVLSDGKKTERRRINNEGLLLPSTLMAYSDQKPTISLSLYLFLRGSSPCNDLFPHNWGLPSGIFIILICVCLRLCLHDNGIKRRRLSILFWYSTFLIWWKKCYNQVKKNYNTILELKQYETVSYPDDIL